MENPSQTKNERKKYFFFVFLFVVLIGADQIVKYFINNPFLNYNFAFSLPLPKVSIYLIYFFVIAGIVYYNVKNFSKLKTVHKIAWVFILSGAISNIGERILFGGVKDFIYIHLGNMVGIYNLADFYIILGILGLVLF